MKREKTEINIITGGLAISAIMIGYIMEESISEKKIKIRMENKEYWMKLIPIIYSGVGIIIGTRSVGDKRITRFIMNRWYIDEWWAQMGNRIIHTRMKEIENGWLTEIDTRKIPREWISVTYEKEKKGNYTNKWTWKSRYIYQWMIILIGYTIYKGNRNEI